MAVRGGLQLALIIFALLVYDFGRLSLHPDVEPAFVIPAATMARVYIAGAGETLDGIHQINDADGLISAIKLTGLRVEPAERLLLEDSGPPFDGKSYLLQIDSGKVSALEIGWMSAAMRMSLGIPLCVDQMSRADWDDLPAVGPALAQRLDEYRHKNGAKNAFHELAEVSGVGQKRLDSWRSFFSDCK